MFDERNAWDRMEIEKGLTAGRRPERNSPGQAEVQVLKTWTSHYY